MYWNYRVVNTGDGFELHEVYYDVNDKPYARTKDCYVYGDTVEELKNSLVKMLEATEKLVLNDDDIGEENES